MRNSFFSQLLFTVVGAGVLTLASAQNNGLSQIHPGYTLTDIQPANNKFLVGGLGLYSNGNMAVCTWGNPGEVYLVKGFAAGDKSAVSATRFAYGLQQSLGCKVVDDTLYVMQMGELTQVVDSDGDGKADQYNKVNAAYSTSESLLGYAYDVQYFGGSFYAVLSADVSFGGMSFKPALKERSRMIKMNRDGTLEYIASGFRNPNGMGLGYGNRLFSTDNQGSWLPSSKVIHLQKGKFYGHRSEPANIFQDQPETWPLAWLPHGIVSMNPGNIEFFREGIYKGQLLLAEVDKRLGGRLYRISVEEANGVMQGAVLPFCGGIGTGVCRTMIGPGGTIYAGNLGADGNWGDEASMVPGLKRLTPKDNSKAAVFEMLNVRSTGPSTVEIEFTKAPGAGANDVGKYGAEIWTFDPQEGYGAGNQADKHSVDIQSATLKPDGKTVELKINGLKLKYLLHLSLKGLTSGDGEASWTPDAWLTLNQFGPGKVPEITGCMDNKYREFDALATASDPTACATLKSNMVSIRKSEIHGAHDLGGAFNLKGLSTKVQPHEPYTLQCVSLNGEVIRQVSGWGNSALLQDLNEFQSTKASRIRPGLYLLKLQTPTFQKSLPFLIAP